jgi:APA family basic amino acid/polyamine antiporter
MSGSLSREITIATGTAVVVANVIGSGIFTTSGFIARDLGTPFWFLGVWVIGGMLALAGALSYSEMGAAMPEAGGEYVYLREAYGPLVGYLSGWTSFFIGFSGAIAAACIGFVAYLHHFFPGLEPEKATGKAAALAALWALTAAHVAGVGPGSLLQRILTAGKVAAIGGLIAAGALLGKGQAAHFSSSGPAAGSVAVSLIFVLYSYSGWNAAAYLAGEMRDPQRSVPRSLLLGTAMVILLYVGLNALYLYALPIPEMSGVLAIGERASVALFGPAATSVVSAILALSILASASAMVFAGPRVYYAMARDSVFPPALGAIHPSFGTPARAIFLQSLWTSVLIIFSRAFEQLVIYTGFALSVFAALAVAALIVLRVRRPDAPRPFRVPLYPWLPAAYVAMSAWIAVYSVRGRPKETLYGVLTVLAGIPFYWWSRRHAQP